MLVLLVPRELRVERTNVVKAMTDMELEAAIEAVQAMLAAREAGQNAKVIIGVTENPETSETPPPRPRSRRKAVRNMGMDMGTESDSANS